MVDIKWSAPYKVLYGNDAKWRREWAIPKEMLGGFFEFWNKSKFKLLAEGFGVSKSKIKEQWYFYETKSDVALFRVFSSSTSSPPPIVKAIELPPYVVKHTDGLRPWQVDACGKLISAINYWGGACDGSDLGTGKTFCACNVARELDVPFVVVCPKPVITQWKKVIHEHFKMDNLFGIINYEMLIRGRKDSKIASYILKREAKRAVFTWKLPKNSIIIWDEAHRLKNFKTKNSKSCILAYKQGYKQLFLSATLASTPLELRTIGTCLKMFKTAPEYYEFLEAHGCYKGIWGMEFNNDKNALKRLHTRIFQERGTRLLRDSIPNFPKTEIIVNAYDIDEESTKKIRDIYDNMKKELKVIESKEKSDGESELTVRIRALQRTELLKIPLIEEMIREGLEQGMSVMVFLNYSDSIDALAKRMNTNCIYDGRNANVRQHNLDLFQANKEPVLITNIAAAREGINAGDEDGLHPRLAIISPNDSVQKLKQCLGRVHRENSKSVSIQKLVYISGTQEENVVDNVGQKLENLTLINNGTITDNDLKI